MINMESILSEQPFLEGLNVEDFKLIVGCASNVCFDPDQFVLHEGEEANNFYIIRHGKVSVEINTAQHGPITVQTIGEGDVLGWSWLVPPHYWRFDARAVEQTRAILLDGKCIRKKCEENHTLGYELLKRFSIVMMQRFEATRLQLLDIYGIPSEKE